MAQTSSLLRWVIEKELRDIIGSTKFAVSFAVCSLLVLLAFYTGAATYHASIARYEAAKRENLKQIEGLTDWVMVRNNRIFLPPDPLASLVSGVSNDIGRTTLVQGRGELTQDESRYNDEPVFAVFRFLDLEFIFQIVLSVFAVLFAYDAINGEKERGTLRLTFANPLPRRTYLAGKFIGSFLALAVPLLIPMLLGALLLLLMRVPMTGDAWIRLSLIIATGILYFGTFLSIAVAVSTLTVRSSDSFVILLVIWIFAVLIIPRSAILIAGRAVDVPSVDEIGAKKARLNQQLWAEDRTAMSRFKPTTIGEPGKMMEEFQKFMGSIADEREKKMNALSSQLLEQRTNAQGTQQSLALGLARVSPAGSFSLAAATLAGTSLLLEERYRTEAKAYQETFGKFMLAKTGMNPGGGMMFRMITDNGVKPKPIDPRELPPFLYRPLTLQDVLPGAVADMGLLALFCLVFIAVAHAAFMRYDLR